MSVPGAEPCPGRDAAGFCLGDPKAKAWGADPWRSGQRGSAPCGPGGPDLNTAREGLPLRAPMACVFVSQLFHLQEQLRARNSPACRVGRGRAAGTR